MVSHIYLAVRIPAPIDLNRRGLDAGNAHARTCCEKRRGDRRANATPARPDNENILVGEVKRRHDP